MQPSLFLAYPLSPEFQAALNQTNPNLLALFTQGRPDYLEYIDRNGQRYLGKWVGEISDMTTLDQLKTNVASLLTRLAPNYAFSSRDFILLAQ